MLLQHRTAFNTGFFALALCAGCSNDQQFIGQLDAPASNLDDVLYADPLLVLNGKDPDGKSELVVMDLAGDLIMPEIALEDLEYSLTETTSYHLYADNLTLFQDRYVLITGYLLYAVDTPLIEVVDLDQADATPYRITLPFDASETVLGVQAVNDALYVLTATAGAYIDNVRFYDDGIYQLHDYDIRVYTLALDGTISLVSAQTLSGIEAFGKETRQDYDWGTGFSLYKTRAPYLGMVHFMKTLDAPNHMDHTFYFFDTTDPNLGWQEYSHTGFENTVLHNEVDYYYPDDGLYSKIHDDAMAEPYVYSCGRLTMDWEDLNGGAEDIDALIEVPDACVVSAWSYNPDQIVTLYASDGEIVLDRYIDSAGVEHPLPLYGEVALLWKQP